MSMFCFQCEQTAGGKGCTKIGVCGKTEIASNLQDVIIHALKSIGVYGLKARELGIIDKEIDLFVIESLFTTITNVDFDEERLYGYVKKAYLMKEKIKRLFLDTYKEKNGKNFEEKLPKAAEWKPADTKEGVLNEAPFLGVMSESDNEDIRSLKQILKYGIKGMAAYTDHAYILGKEDEELMGFFYKSLYALADENISLEALVNLCLEVGKMNIRAMQLLNEGHVEHYGQPTPTKVFLGVKKGPAILVSGHDMLDLEELLKQTEGKGINIYTHGEMLPAHGYPGLKKYSHLVGNYGSAWQNQQKEFDEFPGAILMTTNCIQKPKETYKDRIFTTGLVGWEGVEHIPDRKDFSKVIEKSLELGGFKEDREDKEILVGFGHNAVLSVADKVIEAVKTGTIKHFFLIGGCDGAKPGRNYYTELAEKVPQNCIILTLACGKYRFNKLDFGTINGIPRLLDVGQCNDAYSAVIIASELAKAFGVSVNDLPLSIILSWYEQKAVAVLLSLLYLGIKNIKIGPSLPAFISENVLNVLIQNFNIKPISTPEEDIKEALNK